MQKRNTLVASVLALVVAAPVFAQGALVGIDALDDQIDDIQDAAVDEIDEGQDSQRYGPNQFAQGWTGNIALGFSATSGNTDTTDLDLAGRFRYGNGPWNHTFGFAAEVSEENSVRSKEKVYATYDVNRYLNDQFYVFALGSLRYDDFNSYRWDAFFGVGPGVRVINKEDHAWRVQAGPGVRYLEDQTGIDTTEIAGLLSSRYYYAFSDAVYVTNDTDVLFSETNTTAVNVLAMNYKLTDVLSTRAYYRAEWDSDPLQNFDPSDSSVGIALVYGF